MSFHDSYNSNQVADTYCNAELCFVQEEHKNMGAWSYVQVPLAQKNPRPNLVLSSSVLKLTSQLQPRTQTAIGGYHRLIQVHIFNCFNNFRTSMIHIIFFASCLPFSVYRPRHCTLPRHWKQGHPQEGTFCIPLTGFIIINEEE